MCIDQFAFERGFAAVPEAIRLRVASLSAQGWSSAKNTQASAKIACRVEPRRASESRGGHWVFSFAVLVTFEIGFSVFALKIPAFSVLVSIGVFGFFPF